MNIDNDHRGRAFITNKNKRVLMEINPQSQQCLKTIKNSLKDYDLQNVIIAKAKCIFGISNLLKPRGTKQSLNQVSSLSFVNHSMQAVNRSSATSKCFHWFQVLKVLLKDIRMHSLQVLNGEQPRASLAFTGGVVLLCRIKTLSNLHTPSFLIRKRVETNGWRKSQCR